MEQWEINKRIREYHGRVFLEELFEGSLELKRYVPPEVTVSKEPVMPLNLYSFSL